MSDRATLTEAHEQLVADAEAHARAGRAAAAEDLRRQADEIAEQLDALGETPTEKEVRVVADGTYDDQPEEEGVVYVRLGDVVREVAQRIRAQVDDALAAAGQDVNRLTERVDRLEARTDRLDTVAELAPLAEEMRERAARSDGPPGGIYDEAAPEREAMTPPVEIEESDLVVVGGGLEPSPDPDGPARDEATPDPDTPALDEPDEPLDPATIPLSERPEGPHGEFPTSSDSPVVDGPGQGFGPAPEPVGDASADDGDELPELDAAEVESDDDEDDV